MNSGRFQFIPFPCDLSAVRPALQVCLDFLASEGLSPEDCIAWEHILMEAMANSIFHTPITRELLTPSLTVMVGRDEVEIQITDFSDGFDLPELLDLPEDASESGRGLFIIRSFANEVRYFRSPDENRMVVRRHRERVRVLPPPEPLNEEEGTVAVGAETREEREKSLGDAVAARIMEQELLAARRIQQALLPHAIPRFPTVSIHGECLSAREVGGDFFDVIAWDQQGVLLVIADVMGKGMPAALLAGMLRSHIHAMQEWAIRPGDLLAKVNQRLFTDLEHVEMFITVQLVFIDFRSGQGKVASAGHGPLHVFDGEGQVKRLEVEGMPLGIFPDQAFVHQDFQWPASGGILLLTDGVMEMTNAEGESFGESGLERCLKESIRGMGGPGEMLGSLIESMTMFRGDEAVKDDQTLVLCLSRRAAG